MEARDHGRAVLVPGPRSAPCRAARPSRSSSASGATRSSCANQAWKVRISTGRPAAQHAAVQRRQLVGAASRARRQRQPRSTSAATRCGMGRARRANVGEPVVEPLRASRRRRLRREGDGEDLVRRGAVEQRAQRCARPASRSCPRRRRPRRRTLRARVAGDRVERFARGPARRRRVGRRGHRAPSLARLGPVVAPAQAARVAVLAGAALAERRQARRRRAGARRSSAMPVDRARVARRRDVDMLDRTSRPAGCVHRRGSTALERQRRLARRPAPRRTRAACPRSGSRTLSFSLLDAAGLVVDQLDAGRPCRRDDRCDRCGRAARCRRASRRPRRSLDLAARPAPPRRSRSCSHAT